MASVFITGASGYIGGQVLKEIVHHPRTYGTIRALVRDSRSAKQVEEAYPQVEVVIGDLDNAALIEEEASKAAIVLNAASNKHMDSMRAIHRGLTKRQSSSYWIQVSGASVLAVEELASPSFEPGSASDVIFDDVNDAGKIRSLIRSNASRAVDNFVLDVAASDHPKIRTAIVFPPLIYGPGEGPVKRRSVQVPELARVALTRGNAVQLGEGLSRWGNIHVRDVAKVFAGLADAGAGGSEADGAWGENGLYLPSAGEMSFGEVSERIAKAAYEKGYIATAEVERISADEALKLLPGGKVFFGSNARIKSQRARDELGLEYVEEPLVAEFPRAVDEEAGK